MAFDQTTRNRLSRFVTDARKLLSDEFTRQLQHEYGLDPATGEVTDVEKLGHLDDARRETAVLLRETMEHYLAGSGATGVKARREVLDRIVREQAFTVLNRLCALRMAEARGLLIESVARGYQSKGFQLYGRLAGTALGETGDAYRVYLFSVFDEFAVDLPVLFDRFSPEGRLFPREATLLAVLEEINHSEIDALWAEDETIGWIYQYFNSKEERKAMRDASAAPRNSRELAVRNQFFTPRYVVEFLTDNTLGRIWYEMTQGETALREECRYLVRRPNEVLLHPGEAAPEAPEQEDLSQEELLQQPVYIPHRPLKDPRDLKMLDPACGSMHFGLYAFDLFERIYEEAWEIEGARGADAMLRSEGLAPLGETYAERDAFLRDVPRLIIERNIHGIDIDPRAVQIAGLSLWLRAQRSWERQGVKPQQRPQILRSNIVCAEPMPGEEELVDEFVEERLSATLEQRVLGQLFRQIVEAMTLAGEAGSLLKIEDEIAGAVTDAKKKWVAALSQEQGRLFSDEQVGMEITGISDGTYWEVAEERVYAALRSYAENVHNDQGSYQRRLFADEAARGFAFVDLSQKRYDVVVMNPPFGEASNGLSAYCDRVVRDWSGNLAAAFIIRAGQLAGQSGTVGCICDHSIAVRSTYEEVRRSYLIDRNQLDLWIKLGWGVLEANVETFSAVYTPISDTDNYIVGINVEACPVPDKGEQLLQSIGSVMAEGEDAGYFRHTTIGRLPNCVIDITWPSFLISLFDRFPNLKEHGLEAVVGHQLEADRHYRLYWELDFRSEPLTDGGWTMAFKGGEYSPGYLPEFFVALTGKDYCKVPNTSANVLRNSHLQHNPGVGYGKRGEFVDAQPLRPSSIFTHEGFAFVLPSIDDRWRVLALMNSNLFAFGINKYCGQHKTNGYVNLFPFPPNQHWKTAEVADRLQRYVQLKTRWTAFEEFDYLYVAPALSSVASFQSFSLTELVHYLVEDEVRDLRELYSLDNDLNHYVYDAFGLTQPEVAVCEEYARRRPPLFLTAIGCDSDLKVKQAALADELLSWVVGIGFGHWDIRFATGKQLPRELTNPFAPLPSSPPGKLQLGASPNFSVDGSLAPEHQDCFSYPIELPADGILGDEPGHPYDVLEHVHRVLQVIWKDRWDMIEREACELLGVQTLRDHIQKPTGFFADHLKRYSKSRRQAPIYWPLSTPTGSYTLWFYYHRLTDQTLYTCVNDLVEPKLKQVAEAVAGLRAKSGRSAAEERELERLSTLEAELTDFRDELLRIARFWKPNLNDGVQITAAPLWKLFQHRPWQKKLKETWEKLEAGDYDWAHLAYSIWPERVREKCRTDKSLAIAHGLEELYEEPKAQPKKKRGRRKQEEEDAEFASMDLEG